MSGEMHSDLGFEGLELPPSPRKTSVMMSNVEATSRFCISVVYVLVSDMKAFQSYSRAQGYP